MSLKIRFRKIIPVLFIVIALNLSLFYLLDPAKYHTEDLGLVAALFFGMYLWYKTNRMKTPRFPHGGLMLAAGVLCVLSSFQANRLFGQSFMLGFRVQRTFLIWSLLYFPLYKAFYHSVITVDDFKKMITFVGVIELILFFAQYILTGKVKFLYVGTGTRYGSARYYFQPIWIDMLLIFKLDDMINGKTFGTKVRAFILAALCLLEVMVVQKFRLTFMGLAMITALAFFVAKSSYQKKFVLTIILCILFALLYNTTMVQDILEQLFSDHGHRSAPSIRQEGRVLYLAMLFKHPVLGGGFPHEECYQAAKAAGIFKRIYLVDNGLFGFAYVFGLTGIVWVIALWAKMISNGYKIYKEKGTMFYVLFPMFFLITGINEIHWYWMNGFMVIVFFLILQDMERSSQSKRKLQTCREY